jgi:predicted RNase H-like HicB family nuclease
MTNADVRGYRLEVYRDPEDDAWVAEVPDLPGCVAGGESADEAVEAAADAIEAWIEAATAGHRPIPLPRTADEELSGRFVLRVTRRLHAQLARTARSQGVSLNAFCATALAEAIGSANAERTFVAQKFTFIESGDLLPSLRPLMPSTPGFYRIGGSGETVRVATAPSPSIPQGVVTTGGARTAKGATQ